MATDAELMAAIAAVKSGSFTTQQYEWVVRAAKNAGEVGRLAQQALGIKVGHHII